MKFKAKLRKIGNSIGILIPREVITGKELGEEIEFEVITNKAMPVITGGKKEQDVITPVKKHFNSGWCKKHTTYKGSCGCK